MKLCHNTVDGASAAKTDAPTDSGETDSVWHLLPRQMDRQTADRQCMILAVKTDELTYGRLRDSIWYWLPRLTDDRQTDSVWHWLQRQMDWQTDRQTVCDIGCQDRWTDIWQIERQYMILAAKTDRWQTDRQCMALAARTDRQTNRWPTDRQCITLAAKTDWETMCHINWDHDYYKWIICSWRHLMSTTAVLWQLCMADVQK